MRKSTVAFYVLVWYGESRKNTCKEKRYMFIFAAILFVILTVGVTGVFTMMDACMWEYKYQFCGFFVFLMISIKFLYTSCIKKKTE